MVANNPEAKKPKAKSPAAKPATLAPAAAGTRSNGKAGAPTAKPAAATAKAPTVRPAPGAAKASVVKAPAGTAGSKSKPGAKKPAARAEVVATTAGAAKAAKADKPGKDGKAGKPRKDRLVRDSFTMPESEYEMLAQVKKRCIASGKAVKKSEVLRAAINCFAALGDAAIGKAIAALPPVKTGRPPKEAR